MMCIYKNILYRDFVCLNIWIPELVGVFLWIPCWVLGSRISDNIGMETQAELRCVSYKMLKEVA